jgi:hypothetical protein
MEMETTDTPILDSPAPPATEGILQSWSPLVNHGELDRFTREFSENPTQPIVAIPPPGLIRLCSVSALDFLTRTIPPREMLLTPILPAQGLVMLYGPRGQGKTHVALGIGVAVASGKNFLRWTGAKPHSVLFVDGELPASVLQKWLNEAVALSGADDTLEGLKIITPDLQEFGIPDLCSVGGQAALSEHVESADLIILDNLSALVRTGRENEAESWLPMQSWALDMRRRGKTVLFVHHSGRSGQPRGTSKREDLLDTIIALRTPPTYNPKEGLRAEVHFEKSRGFFGREAEPFEIAMSTGESGTPVWTTANVETSNYERAVKLFEEGCDAPGAMQELGISRAQAYRFRKKWWESQQSHGG